MATEIKCILNRSPRWDRRGALSPDSPSRSSEIMSSGLHSIGKELQRVRCGIVPHKEPEWSFWWEGIH